MTATASSSTIVWPRVAIITVIAATAMVYGPTINAPFIFDDFMTILGNWTIRHLDEPVAILRTPGQGEASSGRPFVNLSFAIDYALYSVQPWGYRLTNLLLHVGCAVALLFLVDFTLRWPQIPDWLRRRAGLFSGILVAVWSVHPVHVEAVAYISPRSELMVTLFYLLTLYLAARGFAEHPGAAAGQKAESTAGSAGWWHLAAVATCFAGMMSKEIMISAPLAVLFYDRAFASGSFAAALRMHRALYIGLALSWIALAASMMLDLRQASVGYDHGITALDALKTHAVVLGIYARLLFWPDPLLLAYGFPEPAPWGPAIIPGIVVLIALGLTGYALWRHPRIGFVAVIPFLILGPTTSFIPVVTEMAAERRMYLPSAACLTLLMLAAGQILHRQVDSRRWIKATVAGVVATLMVALAVRAQAHAQKFHHPLLLWQEAVEHNPPNWLIWNNFGSELVKSASYAEAVRWLESTVEQYPDSALARLNLATAYSALGRRDEAFEIRKQLVVGWPKFVNGLVALAGDYESRGLMNQAIQYFSRAVEVEPHSAVAHARLGLALMIDRRFEPARRHLLRAIELAPHEIALYAHLARVTAELGDLQEARRLLATVEQVSPDLLEADLAEAVIAMRSTDDRELDRVLNRLESTHGEEPELMANIAASLANAGQWPRAESYYRKALERDPSMARALDGLATTLAKQRRFDEAFARFEEAIKAAPSRVETYVNYGAALHEAGRPDDAIAQYDRALEQDPEHAPAHFNRGNALASVERFDEALAAFEQAVRHDPNHPRAQFNLGHLQARAGRLDEAVAAYQRATQLAPNFADAYNHLGIALAQMGRVPEAAAAFEQAVRIRPDYADAAANLQRARQMLQQR